MPSTTTYLSNLVNPEVMGPMIEAKIAAMLKITPYAKVDTSLQGVPGNTITVPSWNYIGDAVEVAEGEEVDLTNMTTGTTQFTIKKAMKAVGITQEAVNSGLGNPIGTAETQLAKSIAGKVDNDVIDAAYTAPITYSGSAAIIGYKPIVSAVGLFADEEDNEKVMFIHPEQETQLLKDSDFISADKFEAGVAVKGAIGKIAGCWIKKSKKVKKLDAVDAVSAVYTIEVKGTVAEGDVIKINNTTVTLDGTSGASATAAATAIATAFGSDATFTVTRSSAKLTFTEKSGKQGTTQQPTTSITSAAGSLEVKTTTAGVKAEAACYACPIIKMEIDSSETEYTDSELPAITIYLKKDLQTDADWKSRKQTWEIVSAKYYGVALTNASKVIVAKFGLVNAS